MSNYTPKLRFKKFTDEWQEKKLGDIGDVVTGNTPTTVDLTLYGGEFNFVSPADINEGRYIGQTKTRLSKKGFDKTRKIPADSTLFVCIGSTIGKIAQTKEEVATNQQINAIVANRNIDKDFLYFGLSRIASKIALLAGNQAVPIINKTDFSRNKIFMPTVQEQEKIAEFLTAVDEKIGKLGEKKKGFEKYKKSAMQAMFSQKIRFRDFSGSDFPDWEEKKLGEIGATYNGLTSKSAEDFGEGEPYITYMQIFGGSSIDMSKCRKVKVGEKENQNEVKVGDIFFTTSSETPEEAGFSSVLLNNDGVAYLNSFCFGYRLGDAANYLPVYLNIFFRSDDFRKKVIRLAQGSTRFNLSKIEMMKIKIQIPVAEEQEKIAEFLTSLDNKINLINNQLEQAKLFKKSLLKRMFA
jgi:type I restriction enzyme S subunit